MDDRELKELMHIAADRCFSGIDAPASRRSEIMKKMRESKRRETKMKKKMTLALVFALVGLLGSVAVAAGLGVFGTFTNHEMSEMSAVRLSALDSVSSEVGMTITLTAPGEALNGAEPANDAQAVIAGQAGRAFTLTIDQAYCDGTKLYYSYMLKTDAPRTVFGEGKPAGIDDWDIVNADRRFEEVWSFLNSDQTAEVAAWLDSHDASYVIIEDAGLGDGVALDGKPLNAYDSNSEWTDENTLKGYQEVRLPKDYETGDEVTVQLSILYGATVFYQDHTGVYCKHLAQSENRGILNTEVTLPVSGHTTAIAGTITTDRYTAEAQMVISDVDIYGTVTVTGVQSGCEDQGQTGILTYVLIAGDEELHNLDGGFSDVVDGAYTLGVRYDLPSSTDNLILHPTGAEEAMNDIVLRRIERIN